MIKKLIVYFGAAGSGLAYCQHSGIVPDIFVDNDSSKWGTFVNGVKVMSPKVLESITLQAVIITSGYIKDILPQILSLGVDRDKIYLPPKSLLGFHPFIDEINRKQAAVKLNEVMTAMGNQKNIVAVGGTALGFFRDNDFIHWDNDIDLFSPIQYKPALIDFLQRLNYGIEDEQDSIMKSIKSTLILENGVEIHFSIDFFDAESRTFVDVFEDYTWEWPTRMFTQCAKVKVHGELMNVPNPPAEYLIKVYGSSWSKPNPEFGYSEYAGDVSQVNECKK